MSAPIRDMESFLQNEIRTQGGFASEVRHLPEGANLAEFQVLSTARVSQLADGRVEIRFVEGPAARASARDSEEIAEELIGAMQRSISAANGIDHVLRIDPGPDFPVEWMEAIATEAKAFLAERDYFVPIIRQDDPERWAVIRRPMPMLSGPRRVTILWDEGPGFGRLPTDYDAEMLVGDLVPRLRAKLPQLADYDIAQRFG